jgi:hypothetical protein
MLDESSTQYLPGPIHASGVPKLAVSRDYLPPLRGRLDLDRLWLVGLEGTLKERGEQMPSALGCVA